MGEARRNQYNRQKLLERHPFCVYCGGKASTTDHNPPRCLFARRVWPESFEYPCCVSCNKIARLDEQAIAFMARIRFFSKLAESEIEEVSLLADGIKNNQPKLVEEWMSKGAVHKKRSFREMFGKDEGDRLRSAGYSMLHLGPITNSLIKRFMIRLGQSMFYNHTETILRGKVYAKHTNLMEMPDPHAFLQASTSIAPIKSNTVRAGRCLSA